MTDEEVLSEVLSKTDYAEFKSALDTVLPALGEDKVKDLLGKYATLDNQSVLRDYSRRYLGL